MWNYYGDETDVDYDASEAKSFKYETKITGNTEERPAKGRNEGNGDRPPQPPVPPFNREVVIPSKCMSNFWTSHSLPFINCEKGI